MLNCQRCGNEFLSGIGRNGKKTINCESCRELHNNKNRHILKCEKLPIDGGFYKHEKNNIVNDNLEEPPEEQQNDTPPCDVLHVQHAEPKPADGNKTIRDLLNDVFNTLEHLEKANAEHMKQTDALTNIVFDILNKLITSENKFNNFIKKIDLKNSMDNGNNDFNDFIKNQDLKNKDFNFKLDKIIACVV